MMKKLAFFAVLLSVLFSCSGNGSSSEGPVFGESFDTTGAISMLALGEQMQGKTSMDCTVKGTIAEVCQSEGCWFTILNEGSEPVTVRMKDHSFTVPKNSAGKAAFFHGTAFTDTTSVETLRDYAKDAGKSEAEIDGIKEAKIGMVVEANGVILQ
ncbi:MAG: DUF4920 domain-containing protein [Bacteroidia bacterium]|nr:DUF4920 domain-containing protein [Bacteroidia bacterium]